MNTSWKQTKRKAFTLSYDDGVVQDVRLIQLLNKYGLKCTFNLNSEFLGKGGFLSKGTIMHYKIRPEDVRELYKDHEVAVHTLTHPLLPSLEEAEVIRQVEQDRLNLEELTGKPVVGMAYPGGGVNNDDRVAQIIKEHTGVKYARTLTNTDSFDEQDNLYRYQPNTHHLNWDRLTRLAKEFVELDTDKPQIFYVWGHSYEMDLDSANWVKLEEFFQFISGREDIFYGTNTEVLLG